MDEAGAADLSSPAVSLPDRLSAVRAGLDAQGQTHLLAAAGELSPLALTALLDQIESIDFTALSQHLEKGVDAASSTADISPVVAYPLDPDDSARRSSHCRAG